MPGTAAGGRVFCSIAIERDVRISRGLFSGTFTPPDFAPSRSSAGLAEAVSGRSFATAFADATVLLDAERLAVCCRALESISAMRSFTIAALAGSFSESER